MGVRNGVADLLRSLSQGQLVEVEFRRYEPAGMVGEVVSASDSWLDLRVVDRYDEQDGHCVIRLDAIWCAGTDTKLARRACFGPPFEAPYAALETWWHSPQLSECRLTLEFPDGTERSGRWRAAGDDWVEIHEEDASGKPCGIYRYLVEDVTRCHLRPHSLIREWGAQR